MASIEHEGIRISYEDCGSGTPLVLGHSFLSSGEMWAAQVGPLAERARVINVDHRGHGRSGQVEKPFTLYDMVGDFVAVLDHLGIERAVWAGLSVGGLVALRAALTVPERVSGLILVDTHAGAEHGLTKLKYRALGVGMRLLGMRPFLPAIVPLMFGRTTRETKPGLVEDWSRRVATIHMPSLLRFLDALMTRDSVIDRLHEIEVPSVVIVGEEDVTLPPSCSSQIAAGVRDSSLVRVPGAGHLSALEQPEAVTGAMLSLLDRLGG